MGWDWGDCRSISPVRNPWARTLSLYKDLERISDTPLKMGFEGFVVKRPSGLKGGRKGRWNTREMLHDWRGRWIVDHVVRVEHLDEELKAIVRKHWPRIDLPLGPRHSRTECDHYSRNHSAQTPDIVAKHFAYDIAEWGYRFEPP